MMKRIEGTGEILILLIPGGPGMSYDYLDVFFEQIDLTRYSVATYLPFHSSSSELDLNLNFAVKELDELIQGLNYKNIYLLGHSFGGVIALDYMSQAANDSAVKKVVISNISYSFSKYNMNLNELRNKLAIEIRDQFNTFESNNDFGAEYWELFFTNWFPKYNFTLGNIPSSMQRSLDTFDVERYADFMGNNPLKIEGKMGAWQMSSQIKNLSTPFLFLAGETDTVFKNDVDFMSEQVENGESDIIPNAAHYPFLENTEPFFERLMSFYDAN